MPKATRVITSLLPMIIENQNINISDMCRECGITRNAYYKIINGSIPRVDTAIRILRYINEKSGSKFEIENLWQA